MRARSPSRASLIGAGPITFSIVNLPYCFSAYTRPATEPGTPAALYPTRLDSLLESGGTLPCASRYIFSVAAAGAFSQEVDEVRPAIGAAEEHEAASSEISGLGMNDCQRESCGDSGVDRVAARLEHFNSRAGGRVHARWLRWRAGAWVGRSGAAATVAATWVHSMQSARRFAVNAHEVEETTRLA